MLPAESKLEIEKLGFISVFPGDKGTGALFLIEQLAVLFDSSVR